MSSLFLRLFFSRLYYRLANVKRSCGLKSNFFLLWQERRVLRDSAERDRGRERSGGVRGKEANEEDGEKIIVAAKGVGKGVEGWRGRLWMVWMYKTDILAFILTRFP